MKIGIVGYGLVGRAVAIGMAEMGHAVSIFDTNYKNCISPGYAFYEEIKDIWMMAERNLESMFDKDIIFICVPSPQNKDGSCDTTIVENVVDKLLLCGYKGIIAIKSTVEPGTTRKLIDKYGTHRICFVPEFLRERYSIQDFMENHDLCVIGALSNTVFDIVKKAHGSLPKRFVRLDPTEAEMTKYFNNIYNATLVTLANSFYELCCKMKIDYSKIKNALVLRDHINDIYLDCSEWLRGFAGVCLPKDTSAIALLCKRLGLKDIHFFGDIVSQNKAYQSSVFNGMRES